MRPRFRARGLPADVHASWLGSVAGRPGAAARILAWARAEDGYVVGSPALLSVGWGRGASGVTGASGVAASVAAGDAAAVDVTDARDADAPDAGAADPRDAAPAAAAADPSDAVAADAPGSPDAAAVEPAADPGGTGGWRHVGWHEIEHGGWNAESRALSWTLYGGRRGRVGLAEPGRLPELFRERVAASIAVERFVPIRGDRGVTVTARRDLAGSGVLSWHSTLTRGLSWSAEGVAEEAERAEAELRSEYGPASSGW